ncbi:MAG TPA: immunoglobulin domain-containing protein [Opitutaceae bacterium]|nr:immunoglobulin domain-containing protein [Opitutaceae bacterium]
MNPSHPGSRLLRAGLSLFATALLAAALPRASGAIAFDSAVSKSGTNASSASWSHTVGSGANTVLVVGLALEDTSSTVLNVSSITYNGVAMSAVPSSAVTAGSSTLDRTVLYYLLNPPAGAHTVSVTFGGAVNGVSAGSISLSGVAQSAPAAAGVNSSTSAKTLSASASVATAGSWVVDAVCSGAGNASFTPGASQTGRWAIGQSSSGGAGSTLAPGATGTASTSWTASSTSQMALSLAVFAPASGGGGATAPTITTQPSSQSVPAGGNATFSVAATGTAPLSYQWKFNGTAISGATSSSYTIAGVTSANAGSYTVTVSNSAGSATSNAATLTVTSGATAPSITTQPSSETVASGSPASFSVVATGTAPLSYQWKFNGAAISGATSSTYSIASAGASNQGSYTVTVSNSAGSVTSSAAILTVTSGGGTGGNAIYDLTGFATLGSGTSGGGVIAATDPAYVQVTTPLQLANAVESANKTAGAVKVIEIMNDLSLGWNEIGSAVQAVGPFRAHAAPKLHPVLISTGVSLLDIKPKGGLTIFSANGATIKHCNFNVKSCSNIIIRNLKFDELWEWDEATKGNYDSNDWDFITVGNGGAVSNLWIDHCTFTKAYDGIVDQKAGCSDVTFSWCKYVGDDEATNPNSFVRQQVAALESNKSGLAFYGFLRSNGFSEEDIIDIIQAHDKTHLAGSNDLDPKNATLSMTFHHLWIQGVWDRCVPRLRAGNVHDYDLYVDDTQVLAAQRLRMARAAAMSASAQNTLNNTYNFDPPVNGAISTESGALLVEKSVYKDCLWPLRNNQTDPSDPEYTGKIEALDSIYQFDNTDGTTTTVRGNSTDPGNPMGPFQAPVIAFSWNGFSSLPYSYTPDDPAGLLPILQSGAGAGVLTWDKSNWLKTSY